MDINANKLAEAVVLAKVWLRERNQFVSRILVSQRGEDALRTLVTGYDPVHPDKVGPLQQLFGLPVVQNPKGDYLVSLQCSAMFWRAVIDDTLIKIEGPTPKDSLWSQWT